jgi:hypothetical protein
VGHTDLRMIVSKSRFQFAHPISVPTLRWMTSQPNHCPLRAFTLTGDL